MDGLPVGVAWRVEEHDRRREALAGLGEGEQLEGLVERAEPAGQADETAALLDEHQLAGEEVLHAHVLAVAGDDRIGALLERQPDRHADRVLAAGALHRGLHDAGTGAGDDHPAGLGQMCGDIAGLHVQRVVGTGAGRSEDGDLRRVAIRREHLERLGHLVDRRGGDLQVDRRRLLLEELHHRADHLRGQPPIPLGGQHGDRIADPLVGTWRRLEWHCVSSRAVHWPWRSVHRAARRSSSGSCSHPHAPALQPHQRGRLQRR
ncbi:MAG: hypothetical protein FD127_3594 [Acidimicrobiaceae bacterium]|nr:MAG: hypothetical protein FD127_3594 [Acidimicrobiaceae bacterium]